MHFCRKEIGVVICIKFLILIAESNLAKEKTAKGIDFCGIAVIGWLADDICEIHSFAEHIACSWGFRRSDSEAIAEDAYKVCEARTMPEQLRIANELLKAIFSFVCQLIYGIYFDFVLIVRGSVSVLYVSDDGGVVRSVFIKRNDGIAELEVIGIELIEVRVFWSLVYHFGEELDVLEGLEEFKLSAYLDFIVEHIIGDVLHAKIVRNMWEEPAAPIANALFTPLSLQLLHHFLQRLIPL